MGFTRRPARSGVMAWMIVALTALWGGTGLAAAIETPAKYAVIMDAETGMTLWGKNPDEPMAPASMSKLMTLEMLFSRLKSGEISEDDTFLISVNAWRKGGAASGSSTMFAEVNSQVPVKDLISSIIVQSGNDACIAVAEAIGGTEENFAAMMTERARELGLETAVFRNSTGWPHPEHRMTARELAKLSRHMIETYPEYYPLFDEREFTWNNVRQENRNPLLYMFAGADGLKTGHTEEAGYGLTGSAIRQGKRFILVVNGLGSKKERANETARLMRMAFGSFVKEQVLSAGDLVGSAEVFQGEEKSVPLVINQDVATYVHRSARKDIEIKLTYNEPVEAPVTKGQTIGTLSVLVPGQDMIEVPLQAAADVKELGFFGKLLLGASNLLMGMVPEDPKKSGAGSTAESSAQ